MWGFSARELFQRSAIATVVVAVLGGVLLLFLRGSQRHHAAERLRLTQAASLRCVVEREHLTRFRAWQLAQLQANRRAMWPRLLKLTLGLGVVAVLGLGALGAVRGQLWNGVLIGLAWTGIVAGSAGAGVFLVALVSVWQARALRRRSSDPQELSIGKDGVLFGSEAQLSFDASLWRIHAHTLDGMRIYVFTTRTLGSKGARYRHTHIPVPETQLAAVEAVIAPVRGALAAGARALPAAT